MPKILFTFSNIEVSFVDISTLLFFSKFNENFSLVLDKNSQLLFPLPSFAITQKSFSKAKNRIEIFSYLPDHHIIEKIIHRHKGYFSNSENRIFYYPTIGYSNSWENLIYLCIFSLVKRREITNIIYSCIKSSEIMDYYNKNSPLTHTLTVDFYNYTSFNNFIRGLAILRNNKNKIFKHNGILNIFEEYLNSTNDFFIIKDIESDVSFSINDFYDLKSKKIDYIWDKVVCTDDNTLKKMIDYDLSDENPNFLYNPLSLIEDFIKINRKEVKGYFELFHKNQLIPKNKEIIIF